MPNRPTELQPLRPWFTGLVLFLAVACRPQPHVVLSNVAATPRSVVQEASRVAEEPQPALAYCVPHVPTTDNILFSLDFDGSDGSREPRFTDPLPTTDLGDEGEVEVSHFSPSSREICQVPDKPTGRRYVLRVPINAELRRLDEFVRFAARRGYDQPIFKTNQTVVAVQIETAEYAFSPNPALEVPETIGTATIEANVDGDYELRARTTDGRDQTATVGQVTLPNPPDMGDCDSKLAESVRQLCAHRSQPCSRVTLVGVNDIGALLAVLGYVNAVAETALPAVAFQRRAPGLDSSPHLDGSFRRNHRVRRFFAAMKPEADTRKLTSRESLAAKKLGLYGPVPKDVAGRVTLADSVDKRIHKQEVTEVGKRRNCPDPGRTAASLVIDGSDKVHLYAEQVRISERAEVLLRAYYDDLQRLRLIVSSEVDEGGDAWDAYLVLGEDGCPIEERIVTRNELPMNRLHWELRQLRNPRTAYSEPLCVGQVP